MIGALEVALDRRALPDGRLVHLTSVAHAVDELLNRAPSPAQAFVGRKCVRPQGRPAHRRRPQHDASTFEHVDPSAVGNQRELVISDLEPAAPPCSYKAEDAGITLEPGQAEAILEKVKEQEHAASLQCRRRGRSELLQRLARRATTTTLCTLESWSGDRRTRRADGVLATEATDKLSSTASG